MFKKFEDKDFNGVFAEFLENCKPHRVEAIYNTEYKYIKEIIWDDEANEKFGSSRTGYEKFKNDKDYSGSMSHGGTTDLRVRTDKDGNILGYMTESKRTNNDNYEHMLKQYELAKAKLIELLDVKDLTNFEYVLEEFSPFRVSMRMGANETIDAIEGLERIYTMYNHPDETEFKDFIDKIKG